MQLSSIAIQNYSLHRETTVELKPVTVLIGRNGGGKSALIEALGTLSRSARGPLSQAFEDTGPFSYRARLFHGAEDTADMGFHVAFEPDVEQDSVDYHLVFGLQDDGRLAIRHERLIAAGDRTVFERTAATAPPEFAELDDDVTALAHMRQQRGYVSDRDQRLMQQSAYALGRLLRYRIDAYAVSTDAADLDLTDEGETPKEPPLGIRGENAASFLYWLSDYNRPDLRRLQSDVAEIIPGFSHFEFSTARPGRVGFSMRFDDRRGTVDARNLSSGTLSVVALLALTYFSGARRPKVLCIEEPELGLTPTTARGVFARFRARPGRSQLLITSHSPHILCAAMNQPDTAVLRAVPDADGIANVTTVREAAIAEHGAPGPILLGQGGGANVEAALRLMEGLN